MSVDFPDMAPITQAAQESASKQFTLHFSCVSVVEGLYVFLAAHPQAALVECLLAASVSQDTDTFVILRLK